MKIPANTERLASSLELTTMQETYRIFGLGGLVDHMNAVRKAVNNDLFGRFLDGELTEEQADYISPVTADDAYDTLRAMEQAAR